MVDMPFGVSRLDSMLDGGVPTGSVVLLATEPGAGGRKFAHTSAAINALATTNNAAFERHYRGIDHEGVIVPANVEYLSVAATADSLETTLTETVSREIAAQAAEGIVHHDLSESYFGATDVPEAWYQHDSEPVSPLPGVDTDGAVGEIDEIGEGSKGDGDDPFEYADTGVDRAVGDADGGDNATGGDSPDGGNSTSGGNSADGNSAGSGVTDIDDAANSGGDPSTPTGGLPGSDGGGEDIGSAEEPAILSAMRASLDDAVGGNLVVIDAITDLDDLPEEMVSWDAVVRLLRGLTQLVTARGGLVLVIADSEAVTDPQLGSLSAATTGTLSFAWETGGSQRVRLLSIRELPGALDRLDRDEIAAFESELHDRGYDLSNVRKIR